MLSKIVFPSSHPCANSAARSGWGIMPNTFLFSFRIPAIFSNDPFGLKGYFSVIFLDHSFLHLLDFGNLTSTGRRYTSSFSSSTRGFSAGGKDDPAVTNEIDYVEIGTLGDALDFGDLTVAALYWSGISSPTRGLTLVADDPASQVINMVTMASTGNAVDFGTQSKTGGYQAAAANPVRGLWAGGYSSAPRQSVGHSSSIEAITMASRGTTQYFGDLASITSQYGDGSSTSTRAVFTIGKIAAGNNFRNNIEYVTIASSGTASDFGDATFPVAYRGVTSDSHGGLGGF